MKGPGPGLKSREMSARSQAPRIGLALLLAATPLCATAEGSTVRAAAGPYEVALTTAGEFGKNNYRTEIKATRGSEVFFHRTTANALAGLSMDQRDVRMDGDCLIFYYLLSSDGLDDWSLFAVRVCDDNLEVSESTIHHQNGEPELRFGRIPVDWDMARTKQDMRKVFDRLFGRKSKNGATYTPKPGSPERVAICDTLRVYVAKTHALAPLKKRIVFKIDSLKVSGNYAFFDGTPIYADGTAALYESLPDMAYVFVLGKVAGQWNVLADFCGTDVPDEGWWMDMRRKLPADFPPAILPAFYRGHLQL